MKSNIKYLFFVSIFFILSCKKDYVADMSNTVNMNGRWWVELYYDVDSDGLLTDADASGLIYAYADFGGPGLVTSNTASNTSDTVMVIDTEGSWPFQFKLPVDYPNLAFDAVAGIPNMEVDGETFSIINGKILKGAAKSLSGGTQDSIVLVIESSDYPDEYYIYSGHRYSGQPEDHY